MIDEPDALRKSADNLNQFAVWAVVWSAIIAFIGFAIGISVGYLIWGS